MDRRAFVGTAGWLLAGVSLTGCASLVATPVTPVGGAVRLPLRNYPQLTQAGGYLKILPAGSYVPLYVLALDEGFAVLSPICTHLQCTVNVEGGVLLCPCHGSTYDREGRVLRGPAQQALRRFPAALTPEGDLVIRIEGA